MTDAAPVVSFTNLIFHHALSQPEKPAIILADRVATYGMMAQGILRVQARLQALDLSSGALVCLSLDSPIRQMIVGAALFRLGHPVLLASHPEHVVPLRLAVGAFLHGPGISLIPGQRHVVVEDAWFAEASTAAAKPPLGFAQESDICCVSLSSGTTGRPKAISLTVKAFHQMMMNYYSTIGYGSWERLLMLVGLSSSWGFSVAAHALFAGRTLVFAANSRESLHMIGLYSVDAIVASSVQVRELVTEQTRAPVPFKSLRTILSAGGLLSLSLIAEARAKLCSGIVILYGSTEAGGTAFATGDQLTAIEGAIGFVAPWAEVAIVGENGDPLPPGTNGIVRIRAPSTQGAPYPPGTDNPSFRDGWFYPGDLGRIGSDGMMVLTGRTSEIINVGGQKLAPDMIEDVMCKHPSVKEAAAFGSFGEAGIEEISIAVVTNRPIADSTLIDWCAERNIPIKRVFVVETLPKTASGKIHRDLLKRQLLDT